jgi:hypothetical protein
MQICLCHVTKIGNSYSTDCSTLRLPIGMVPARFDTDLGNKRPLVLQSISDDGQRATYRQDGSITLVLHNN